MDADVMALLMDANESDAAPDPGGDVSDSGVENLLAQFDEVSGGSDHSTTSPPKAKKAPAALAPPAKTAPATNTPASTNALLSLLGDTEEEAVSGTDDDGATSGNDMDSLLGLIPGGVPPAKKPAAPAPPAAKPPPVAAVAGTAKTVPAAPVKAAPVAPTTIPASKPAGKVAPVPTANPLAGLLSDLEGDDDDDDEESDTPAIPIAPAATFARKPDLPALTVVPATPPTRAVRDDPLAAASTEPAVLIPRSLAGTAAAKHAAGDESESSAGDLDEVMKALVHKDPPKGERPMNEHGHDLTSHLNDLLSAVDESPAPAKKPAAATPGHVPGGALVKQESTNVLAKLLDFSSAEEVEEEVEEEEGDDEDEDIPDIFKTALANSKPAPAAPAKPAPTISPVAAASQSIVKPADLPKSDPPKAAAPAAAKSEATPAASAGAPTAKPAGKATNSQWGKVRAVAAVAGSASETTRKKKAASNPPPTPALVGTPIAPASSDAGLRSAPPVERTPVTPASTFASTTPTSTPAVVPSASVPSPPQPTSQPKAGRREWEKLQSTVAAQAALKKGIRQQPPSAVAPVSAPTTTPAKPTAPLAVPSTPTTPVTPATSIAPVATTAAMGPRAVSSPMPAPSGERRRSSKWDAVEATVKLASSGRKRRNSVSSKRRVSMSARPDSGSGGARSARDMGASFESVRPDPGPTDYVVEEVIEEEFAPMASAAGPTARLDGVASVAYVDEDGRPLGDAEVVVEYVYGDDQEYEYVYLNENDEIIGTAPAPSPQRSPNRSPMRGARQASPTRSAPTRLSSGDTNDDREWDRPLNVRYTSPFPPRALIAGPVKSSLLDRSTTPLGAKTRPDWTNVGGRTVDMSIFDQPLTMRPMSAPEPAPALPPPLASLLDSVPAAGARFFADRASLPDAAPPRAEAPSSARMASLYATKDARSLSEDVGSLADSPPQPPRLQSPSSARLPEPKSRQIRSVPSRPSPTRYPSSSPSTYSTGARPPVFTPPRSSTVNDATPVLLRRDDVAAPVYRRVDDVDYNPRPTMDSLMPTRMSTEPSSVLRFEDIAGPFPSESAPVVRYDSVVGPIRASAPLPPPLGDISDRELEDLRARLVAREHELAVETAAAQQSAREAQRVAAQQRQAEGDAAVAAERQRRRVAEEMRQREAELERRIRALRDSQRRDPPPISSPLGAVQYSPGGGLDDIDSTLAALHATVGLSYQSPVRSGSPTRKTTAYGYSDRRLPSREDLVTSQALFISASLRHNN